ncbi:EAL domain-containing protein [Nautilia lithotrophica]
MNDLQKVMKFTKNFNVLYVEDNKDALEETKLIFEKFFRNVITAKDGLEGLEKFNSNQIDLIITDINMPKLNGLEMIKKIKEKSPNINTLVVSAYNETEYFIEAIKLGVDGFILKPFEIDQFVEILKKITHNLLLKKEAKEFENLLKQYQNIVDKSVMVAKFDTNKHFTYVNGEFCKIFGYSKDEIIGKQIDYMIYNADKIQKEIEEFWRNIINEKNLFSEIIKCKDKNGKIVYIKALISPILDEYGNIIELISICYDISEMMKPKKLLYDYLENAKDPFVGLIEIENFQSFRNFFGEKIAETIEHKFEDHLKSFLPEGIDKVFDLDEGEYVIVADLNGNEFTYGKYIEELKKLQKQINYSQLDIGEFLYDVTVIISVSKGKEAFENARIGMNKIKHNRDSFIIADGLLEIEKEIAQENLQILHILKEAIDNKNIICFYQPIIENSTQKIVKYETLVRIQYNNEIIPPAKFIDVAKQGVYYSKITEIVLSEAFDIVKKFKDYDISINISEIDIEKEIVRELIYEMLRDNKEFAKYVTFELLEDADVEKYDVLEEFITKIKNLGVTIAIDDFGSGYSNFIRLINYKPDFLKLDGTLIKDIHKDKFSYSVVKSIVEFAKANNIKTIAEFVENEEIFKKVKELGIDYSQGYYFGKPERLQL